ncbi:glycosyltransferase [Frankia sp. CNm7]|uniref:Glycosyltransferase n=1 Tax=Frankia nepalensis TaxID=1836974 RepID=A0A937UVB1_9ACTN|nr:glycosyltransferase [Frankia nepalensis]MBL7494975.1 glycosyltransferase [Frankia nepalensis]MBL7514598.1 glycosyltransferase [Frankia nepalensis]MBL7523834.1 glycosyltransferase [Frankia nepalensis]MBL7633075.1 glycosyltransferase [Frankia nepalensis]
MTTPISFAHLFRLSDDIGLFEHALGSVPRREHGYCVDDVARGLVVLSREPSPPLELIRLLERYLDFVRAAQAPDGKVVNRRGTANGRRDKPEVGDCWGRALWGLGTAAALAPTSRLRAQARTGFHTSAHRRSPWPRAMTFAALGAGELLLAHPDDRSARALLADAVTVIGPLGDDPAWPWPEPTLRYANGAVPEALILAGMCLPDRAVLANGLRLLAWLLRVETRGEVLSPTPVDGRRPRGDPGPGFDQQPIEAAAIADACARAYAATGQNRWLTGLGRAHGWFLGANDTGMPLVDTATGGCHDGLEAEGRNANQGAESTLALLSTAQHAHRLLASRTP